LPEHILVAPISTNIILRVIVQNVCSQILRLLIVNSIKQASIYIKPYYEQHQTGLNLY